ncbi:MAG: pilus assembly protein PilM, partial [Desulfobacterales bacterium]
MLFQDGIGLDISDQKVAVVYLKSSMKGPELIAHEVIPLDPRKTFRDQLETTAHQLKAFIDAHRLNGCGTFLGIPQEKLLLREISLPLAAKENLTETIRYELDRYMPIPEEDIYIDSQIAGEDRKSNRLAVTLIAAKKSEVSAFIELANHCGLGLSGIEPSSAGALHLLTRIDGLLTTSEFVLAAMGSTQWHLTAGSDGRLRSVRTLPAPPSNGSDPGPVDSALK